MRRIFCVCLLLIWSLPTLSLQAAGAGNGLVRQEAGPGIIILDDASPDGRGDFPPVYFNHSAHARALEGLELNCASCHEGYLPGKAVHDAKASSARKTRDLFHAGCISCHNDLRSEAESGPLTLECRSCHNTFPAEREQMEPGGMDPAIHYLHYTSPALGGDPDPEASCSACHADGSPKAPLVKMDHERCIGCHQEKQALPAGTRTGPVDCISCHDAGMKAAITAEAAAAHNIPEDLPRLEAGQPDAAFIHLSLDAYTEKSLSMNPIAFDHLRHEGAVPGCLSCHHQGLANCSSCHENFYAANETEAVPLRQAFHDPDATNSCVGCHERSKSANTECAGCHAARLPAREPACASCHAELPLLPSPAEKAYSKIDLDELAALIAEERRPEPVSIIPDRTGLPLRVEIGRLANEYEPVVFNHDLILRGLEAGLLRAAPGLAALHGQSLCSSCHHNSGFSEEAVSPPPCASCHAAAPSFEAAADGRPELKAAYHQRCLSCHEAMDLAYPAETDCAACHEKRVARP